MDGRDDCRQDQQTVAARTAVGATLVAARRDRNKRTQTSPRRPHGSPLPVVPYMDEKEECARANDDERNQFVQREWEHERKNSRDGGESIV